MPYIKGLGVKELYLIKKARIGKKSEIHADCEDNEPRLVFELERLSSLAYYKHIRLNIFNTYRDTVAGSIFE